MKTIQTKKIKYTLFISAILILLAPFLGSSANGQVDRVVPEREYINPEEMVSLSKDMNFDEAIDLLNEYAQKYENKFIIDRTGTTDGIDIPISKVHWREVLHYIADVQGLVVKESPRYFEVIEPQVDDRYQTTESTGQQEVEKLPVDFGSREVRIKAIFFEGNKRALREIGIDWSTIHNLGSRPANLSQVIDPSSSGGSGGGSGDSGGGRQGLSDLNFGNEYVEVNSQAAQEVTQNLFNGVVNFGEIVNSGIEVRALFKAFEANNLGKILATPEIKVLAGEEGRIQVGQDFSIKQRDFAGNIIDKFFSVGTILTVKPFIIHDGDSTFIDMVINAERSTAQPDPVSTIINKQEAYSEILLLDGESTVIAGLFRTENIKVRKGIPILKDIPAWFFGLRYLFGYNANDRVEQELVILIKASIEPSLENRRKSRLKSAEEILLQQRSDFRQMGKSYEEVVKEEAGISNELEKDSKEE